MLTLSLLTSLAQATDWNSSGLTTPGSSVKKFATFATSGAATTPLTAQQVVDLSDAHEYTDFECLEAQVQAQTYARDYTDDAVIECLAAIPAEVADQLDSFAEDARSPYNRGLGANARVVWAQMTLQNLSSSTFATGTNYINLHVEETAVRDYDQISVNCSSVALNLQFAVYEINSASGKPEDLLWSSPSVSCSGGGEKGVPFANGTFTAAGAAIKDADNDMRLFHGDEVALAVATSGNIVIKTIPTSAVRPLAQDALGLGPAFGWQFTSNFGTWTADIGAVVTGRSTGSMPAIMLREP